MIVKQLNGNTSSMEVGVGVRGLRIVNITLDATDIHNLVSLADKDRLAAFLYALRCAAVTPEPTTNFKPVDKENEDLKRQGKDYLCVATFKQ